MEAINILWIFVVVAAAVGTVAAWIVYRKSSTKRLQSRFGPEYRTTVEKLGSRSKGEAELTAREQRVQRLALTTLTPADAAGFSESWAALQGRFVDDPKGVVAGADELVRRLILRRGYPNGDFEHLAADISVDHADIVQHYRAAQAIAVHGESGAASTEDLRSAVIHYRVIFAELLETAAVTAAATPVQPVALHP
ncbi:MAG: hypothetical protein ACHQIL_10765 [Steroidobacterales bacterium]